MEGHVLQQIRPINQDNVFTEEEALKLAPLLTFLCDKAKKEISQIETQISYMPLDNPRRDELQKRIESIVKTWSQKIKRLGGIPENLSKIKLPTKSGFFYWEHIKVEK